MTESGERDLSRCPACGDIWENSAPRWHSCAASARLVALAAPGMSDKELLERVRGVMQSDVFGRAVIMPERQYAARDRRASGAAGEGEP
jgi:hypothetical protein